MPKISAYPDGGVPQSADKLIEARAGANFSILWSAVGAIAWNAVTVFANSWVNYGGSEVVAQYGLNGLGYLFLKGTIKNGTTGSAAFTLPAGYRPAEKKTLLCISANGVDYIDINVDGTVVPQGTTAPAYFVLMGSTPLT